MAYDQNQIVLPNNQPAVTPVSGTLGNLIGNIDSLTNVSDSLNRRATEIQNQLAQHDQLQAQLNSLGSQPNPRAVQTIQSQMNAINPAILNQELADINNRRSYVDTQLKQNQGVADNMQANARPQNVSDVANILGANLTQPVAAPVNTEAATTALPTVSEQYKQLADQARQRGNTEEANRLTLLANDNDMFSKFKNQATDLLNAGFNIINPVNKEYAGVMAAVDADIKDKLNTSKETFESQYGPQGAQTQRLNSLYSDLGDYITKNFAEEQALQQALGTKSGATASQQIASRNKVANDQLEQILKIKQDEVKQYEGLYNNYNALLNNFIQQYAGSTDKNVVETYKNIFNINQALNTQWIEAQRALDAADLSNSLNISAQARASKAAIDLANATKATAPATTTATNLTSTSIPAPVIVKKVIGQNTDGTPIYEK